MVVSLHSGSSCVCMPMLVLGLHGHAPGITWCTLAPRTGMHGERRRSSQLHWGRGGARDSSHWRTLKGKEELKTRQVVHNSFVPSPPARGQLSRAAQGSSSFWSPLLKWRPCIIWRERQSIAQGLESRDSLASVPFSSKWFWLKEHQSRSLAAGDLLEAVLAPEFENTVSWAYHDRTAEETLMASSRCLGTLGKLSPATIVVKHTYPNLTHHLAAFQRVLPKTPLLQPLGPYCFNLV